MGTLLVLVGLPGNFNAIANIWEPDLGKNVKSSIQLSKAENPRLSPLGHFQK